MEMASIDSKGAFHQQLRAWAPTQTQTYHQYGQAQGTNSRWTWARKMAGMRLLTLTNGPGLQPRPTPIIDGRAQGGRRREVAGVERIAWCGTGIVTECRACARANVCLHLRPRLWVFSGIKTPTEWRTMVFTMAGHREHGKTANIAQWERIKRTHISHITCLNQWV